jgi:hypothetical protein
LCPAPERRRPFRMVAEEVAELGCGVTSTAQSRGPQALCPRHQVEVSPHELCGSHRRHRTGALAGE